MKPDEIQQQQRHLGVDKFRMGLFVKVRNCEGDSFQNKSVLLGFTWNLTLRH